jgi:hypothetical protein
MISLKSNSLKNTVHSIAQKSILLKIEMIFTPHGVQLDPMYYEVLSQIISLFLRK